MKLFRQLVRIAFRNVIQSRKKSGIAILAIASGFIALNLFQGYIAEAEVMFEETYARRLMLGDVLVKKTIDLSDAELFTEDEQTFIEHFIKSDNEVAGRVRFLEVSGLITNGSTSTVFSGYGYDVKDGFEMREPVWGWNTTAGRPLDQGAETRHILIGQALGAILDCYPEKKQSFLTGTGGYKPEVRPFQCKTNRMQLSVSTISGQLNAQDVEPYGMVDGIFRELDLRFLSMPLEAAQKLLDTQGISQYNIRLRSMKNLDAFVARFKNAAKDAGFHFHIGPWEIFPVGEYYVKSMDFLFIFRNFIVIVILAIAVLSVLNTLIRIVQERTREIGTLRSLGFRSRQVQSIFVLEAFFLGLFGNIIGWILAYSLAWFINILGILYRSGVLSEPVPFRVWPTLTQSVQSSVVLLVVAVLASIIPTQWAVRKKITECLTSV